MRVHTSILTCIHNLAVYVPSLISSVSAQSSREFEWLILDDGSLDGTKRALEDVSDWGRVRLFRFPKRLGLTAARNHLLQKARGEYISILDGDDLISPTKVESHARLLDQNPEVGVVWGRCLIVSMEPGGKTRLLPGRSFRPGWDLATPYEVSHSATTWRKRDLISIGGYDPQMTAVEAVDSFLKVGDHRQQMFSETIDALKRIHPQIGFRPEVERKGKELSNQVLLKTIQRRYGHRRAKELARLLLR